MSLPTLNSISGNLASHSAENDHSLVQTDGGDWICGECGYCEHCDGPCRDESAPDA